MKLSLLLILLGATTIAATTLPDTLTDSNAVDIGVNKDNKEIIVVRTSDELEKIVLGATTLATKNNGIITWRK